MDIFTSCGHSHLCGHFHLVKPFSPCMGIFTSHGHFSSCMAIVTSCGHLDLTWQFSPCVSIFTSHGHFSPHMAVLTLHGHFYLAWPFLTLCGHSHLVAFSPHMAIYHLVWPLSPCMGIFSSHGPTSCVLPATTPKIILYAP